MSDTKRLIDKILAGDNNAFKSLIEEYQRLVSHIVFRMINREADREDICQDIFIKVFQNLAEFKFESKLSTWIAKIAYNRCINFLEKKRIPLLDDFSPEDVELIKRAWELISKHDLRIKAAFQRAREKDKGLQLNLGLEISPQNSE